jgi:CheY-like chemotaxis protein
MSPVQSLILVVDDDADLRRMMTDFLTGEGFRVATAADGRAGFDQAARLRPAAILLDYAMPLMDGWRCAEKLRHNPITSHIPIIALTSNADQTSRNLAMRAGVDHFVPKPFDLEGLLNEIHRALKPR